MEKKKVNPQLLQAFELLRSLIEETDTGIDLENIQSHWQFPLIPPPDPQGFISATDLLGCWFRAPLNAPNPWDLYLNKPLPFSSPMRNPHSNSSHPRNSMSSFFADSLSLLLEPGSGTAEGLNRLLSGPEDQLNDSDAEIVVECLYQFIHALNNYDIESAMKQVADDYHVIEEDREIDCLGLRHQCESLLDSFRGWEIEISLTEVPEPIPHSSGILIFAKIQIDARHLKDNERRSILDKRLAVFKKQDNDTWQIAALSRIDNR